MLRILKDMYGGSGQYSDPGNLLHAHGGPPIEKRHLKPKSYKCFGSRLAEIVTGTEHFPEFEPDPDQGTF
jgi:hypothetical protein